LIVYRIIYYTNKLAENYATGNIHHAHDGCALCAIHYVNFGCLKSCPNNAFTHLGGTSYGCVERCQNYDKLSFHSREHGSGITHNNDVALGKFWNAVAVLIKKEPAREVVGCTKAFKLKIVEIAKTF